MFENCCILSKLFVKFKRHIQQMHPEIPEYERREIQKKLDKKDEQNRKRYFYCFSKMKQKQDAGLYCKQFKDNYYRLNIGEISEKTKNH